MTKERQKTACLLISQESPKLPSVYFEYYKRTKYILSVFYAARLFSFEFLPSVLFFLERSERKPTNKYVSAIWFEKFLECLLFTSLLILPLWC